MKVLSDPGSQIQMDTSEGTFRANTFSQNGYTGISAEFVAKDDTGQPPGRPAVNIEFEEDGTLRVLVYDNTSEDPVYEIKFNDGRVEQKSFDVETPKGIIRAVELADKDNPGIGLLYIDRKEKEHSSCTMQFLQNEENSDEGRTVGNIFGPKDPDGEPVFTFEMD